MAADVLRYDRDREWLGWSGHSAGGHSERVVPRDDGRKGRSGYHDGPPREDGRVLLRCVPQEVSGQPVQVRGRAAVHQQMQSRQGLTLEVGRVVGYGPMLMENRGR